MKLTRIGQRILGDDPKKRTYKLTESATKILANSKVKQSPVPIEENPATQSIPTQGNLGESKPTDFFNQEKPSRYGFESQPQDVTANPQSSPPPESATADLPILKEVGKIYEQSVKPFKLSSDKDYIENPLKSIADDLTQLGTLSMVPFELSNLLVPDTPIKDASMNLIEKVFGQVAELPIEILQPFREISQATGLTDIAQNISGMNDEQFEGTKESMDNAIRTIAPFLLPTAIPVLKKMGKSLKEIPIEERPAFVKEVSKLQDITNILEKDKAEVQRTFTEATTPEERLGAINTIEKIEKKQAEYTEKINNKILEKKEKVIGNQKTRRVTLEVPEQKSYETVVDEFFVAKENNQPLKLTKDSDISDIQDQGKLNNLNYQISQHNINIAKQTGDYSILTPEYVNMEMKNIKGQVNKLKLNTEIESKNIKSKIDEAKTPEQVKAVKEELKVIKDKADLKNQVEEVKPETSIKSETVNKTSKESVNKSEQSIIDTDLEINDVRDRIGKENMQTIRNPLNTNQNLVVDLKTKSIWYPEDNWGNRWSKYKNPPEELVKEINWEKAQIYKDNVKKPIEQRIDPEQVKELVSLPTETKQLSVEAEIKLNSLKKTKDKTHKVDVTNSNEQRPYQELFDAGLIKKGEYSKGFQDYYVESETKQPVKDKVRIRKERRDLESKIDIDKTQYRGIGFDGVSNAELLNLFEQFPNWKNLTRAEQDYFNDKAIASNSFENFVKSEYGENPPQKILDELRAEYDNAKKNVKDKPESKVKDDKPAWQTPLEDYIPTKEKILGYLDKETIDGLDRSYKDEGGTEGFVKSIQENSKDVHKKQVEKAISVGKTVPEEVLKDYPDLSSPKSSQAEKPVVYRGQQKGSEGGQWFTSSKEFATEFANKQRGGKKSNGEVIEHTVDGSVLDFPYTVTEQAKISDKLGQLFKSNEKEIRSALKESNQPYLADSKSLRIHTLLENEGIQKLLKDKGFDYVKAKENLTPSKSVDTYLKLEKPVKPVAEKEVKVSSEKKSLKEIKTDALKQIDEVNNSIKDYYTKQGWELDTKITLSIKNEVAQFLKDKGHKISKTERGDYQVQIDLGGNGTYKIPLDMLDEFRKKIDKTLVDSDKPIKQAPEITGKKPSVGMPYDKSAHYLEKFLVDDVANYREAVRVGNEKLTKTLEENISKADVKKLEASLRKELAEQLKDTPLHKKYLKAKEDLGKLPDKMSAFPVDYYAKQAKNIATIGRYIVENGAKKFSDFARQMIKDVGEWIRPKLRTLWNELAKDRTGLENVVTQGLNSKSQFPNSKIQETLYHGTHKGFKGLDKNFDYENIPDSMGQIRDYEVPYGVVFLTNDIRRAKVYGEKQVAFDIDAKKVLKVDAGMESPDRFFDNDYNGKNKIWSKFEDGGYDVIEITGETPLHGKTKVYITYPDNLKPKKSSLWDEVTKDRTGLENVKQAGLFDFRKKVVKENVERPTEPPVKDASELKLTNQQRQKILKSEIFTKGDKEAGPDKFHYDRFSDINDVNELVRNVTKENKKEVDLQKRDMVSWAKSKENAEYLKALGWDERSVLSAVKGDSQLPGRIVASKDYILTAGKELLESIKNLPEGTDAKVALADKFLKYNALVKNTKGLISEAGRALNITKMKSSEDIKVKVDLADELTKLGLEGEIEGLGKVLEIIEPTWKDKFFYWWYNSLLSNPLTDVANIGGNLTHFGWEAMTTALTEKPSTSVNIFRDLKEAHREGMKEVKKIWEGREIADSKFDYNDRQYVQAFSPTSKTGKRIKSILPTTRLAMEDAYFRNLFGGLRKRKTLEAIAKETGDPYSQVMSTIEAVYKNPELALLDKKFEIYDKHLEALERYIDFGVFQTPLGKTGKKWVELGNSTLLLKPLTLFSKIAVNLTKASFRNTPYGLRDFMKVEKGKPKSKWNDMTPLERKDIIRRAVAGTTFFAGITGLMGKDLIEITGRGPDDKDKRELWQKQGYKSNHFYIKSNGEKYGFSYQNISPFNIAFGLIGALSDDAKYNQKSKDSDDSLLEKGIKGVLGAAEVLTTQSFMQGIDQTIRYIKDKDVEGLQKYFQSLVTPAILGFPRDLKNYVTGQEKGQFETDSALDRLKDKTGLTEGLKPKLNQFGEQKTSPLQRFPFPVTKLEADSPLTTFLAENKIEIAYPNKSAKIGNELMSEEQYYDYLQTSGERITKELSEKLPELEKLKSLEDKDYMVHYIVDKVRQEVRDEMGGPKLEDDAQAKKEQEEERKELVESFGYKKDKTKKKSGNYQEFGKSKNYQSKSKYIPLKLK